MKSLNEQSARWRKLMGLNESPADSDLDVYEIKCRDIEGQLKELIEYIAENGNGGHSFSIVVDPGDTENERKFYWDGDGADYIKSIELVQKRKKR